MKIVVGIPTLNGPDRLGRVLRSIRECTNFDRFDVKVLVCDDGSTPEKLEQNKAEIHGEDTLRHRAGLEMLMHQSRRGIAAGWNSTVRHMPADVHVLLNDDVEVVPHWLDVLVFGVTQNEIAGMVGLNAYTGVIKEQVEQWPAKIIGTEPHAYRPRIDYNEAHFLDGDGSLITSCGFAFAFRRDVYEKVGGFDERYFCYYEEVDFGVALRRIGYRHFMASYPIIYHMGGATNSDIANVNASEQMLRSRGLFAEKWGGSPDKIRRLFAQDDAESMRMFSVRHWNTQLAYLID